MTTHIYTVGTRGQHDASFIDLLRRHDLDAVIDIRLRNEGRYYRFAAGHHMRKLLEENGIAYRREIHFAPTAAMLSSLKSDGNWDHYVDEYAILIAKRRMGELWMSRYALYRHPCLLCAEHLPSHCHRRLLAEFLARKLALPIIHLPCAVIRRPGPDEGRVPRHVIQ